MVVADDRLSEAEFECAARARTQKGYPWGDEVGENNAKCINRGSRRDNRRPLPGRLLCGESGWASMTCAATSGSGWRIVITKTIGEHRGTTRRGSKAQSDNQRVVRAGSWLHITQVLRSASRYGGHHRRPRLSGEACVHYSLKFYTWTRLFYRNDGMRPVEICMT
jgi:formylglycine-generating enzyme required for sulfatase activity